MEQSKLNREIKDNFEDFGFYGESLILDSAANVAEKFVREIAQEFALYCMNELGYDQSTTIDEQFNEFLKQNITF